MSQLKTPKPEDAPAFAPIRQDVKFAYLYDEREEHAAAARKAQADYRLMMRVFLAATTTTAILGALSLYGDPAPSSGAQVVGDHFKTFFSNANVRLSIQLLQATAVIVAGYSAFSLANGGHLDLWRKHRERAEEKRVDRASKALEIGHAKGGEAFKAAADFLLADLVTGQIAYLTSAINKQEWSARWQRRLAGGVLAVAGGAPLLMAADVSGIVLVGAIAAVVAPALIASFKSWGEATGSAERIKLHETTRSMLRGVAAHHEELDAAVAANDLSGAKVYADKVFTALRTDVEGFLKVMGTAPTPSAPDLPDRKL